MERPDVILSDPGVAKPEPEPDSEPATLSKEALDRWEHLQKESYTRSMATLARLELQTEERKDSARRTDSWVKSERRHSVTQGLVPASHFDKDTEPVSKTFPVAGRHDNEFTPGAFSGSFPRLGLLPDVNTPDKWLAAEAEQTAGEVQHPLAIQPEAEPEAGGDANTSSPTLPHTEPDADTDDYGEAMRSLFAPLNPNSTIPPHVPDTEAQRAPDSGVDEAPRDTSQPT